MRVNLTEEQKEWGLVGGEFLTIPANVHEECHISVSRDGEDESCDRLAVIYFVDDETHSNSPLCQRHFKSIRRHGMGME